MISMTSCLKYVSIKPHLCEHYTAGSKNSVTVQGQASLMHQEVVVLQIKYHIDNDPKVTIRALEEVMDTSRETIRQVLVENFRTTLLMTTKRRE